MKWLDGHCDVLWRMWEKKENPPSFYKEDSYDVTYPRILQAKVKMQWFAIFIPPTVPQGQRLKEALQQIDLFYLNIVQNKEKMVPFASVESFYTLKKDQCGAILHLEGADALEGDISNLRILAQLGVRQVGLTWNFANDLADGIWEKRNGGLTHFGYEVVREMARLNMVVDVSHLSVQGFWDVMELDDIAVVASHSNCQSICSHKRNLSDEQIKALVAKKGLIGINFIPFFLYNTSHQAKVEDIYRHIDHLCQLGGSNSIYFGSDFDGDTEKLSGLEHMGKLPLFTKSLLRLYGRKEVENWIWNNGFKFYQDHL